MTCESKNCEDFKDYSYWENCKLEDIENPYNLCDTDILPSMPDTCSRCKRAYRDFYREERK